MTQLNDLLTTAKRIVFLTGAGVSTASGIPDYRSKNGLYANKRRPEYLLSHTCLVKEPEVFYEYLKANLYYPKAEPNIIHEKMAAFTKVKRATIITQNIDGLHAKAGSDLERLVEFHGNLYDLYCQKCGQTVTYKTYLKNMYHQDCGGILRPDVVLYEEGIKQARLNQALTALSQADLVVVCGTSFVVYPFAGLIQYRSPKAKVVAVNKEVISLPSDGIMIQGDAVKEFAQVDNP